MAIQYLKKSPKTSSTDDSKTTGIVQDLLKDIESTKEQGCIDLTKKFDKYEGEIVKGNKTGNVRSTTFKLQAPEFPKEASFFGQQKKAN